MTLPSQFSKMWYVKGKVLTVHVRKRRNLWLVIKGYYGNNGIRSGAVPGHMEGVIGSGNFNDNVGLRKLFLIFSETVCRYKNQLQLGNDRTNIRLVPH